MSPPRRRALAVVAPAVLLAVAAAGAAGLLTLAERDPARAPETGFDAVEVLTKRIDALAGWPRQPDEWHVAFLGDSTVEPRKDRRGLPDRLNVRANQLARGRARIRVHGLAAPGMDPVGFFLISGAVARARPDQVVMPVNLGIFAPVWRASFTRPELALLLEPDAIPTALGLGLYRAELPADRMLTYAAAGRLELLPAWARVARAQARLGRLRAETASAVDRRLGGASHLRLAQRRSEREEARFREPGGARYNRAGTRRRYGAAFDGVPPDHAMLRALAAAVRRFESAGIPTLVYVAPANLEHARGLGVLEGDEAGLRRTLERVREVVEAAGGRSLTLVDLLEDAAFRDPAGHLRSAAEPLPADRIAVRLARAVQPRREGR